ncbi:hypothetical protein MRX96_041065 [Rhipicephalus microplus]
MTSSPSQPFGYGQPTGSSLTAAGSAAWRWGFPGGTLSRHVRCRQGDQLVIIWGPGPARHSRGHTLSVPSVGGEASANKSVWFPTSISAAATAGITKQPKYADNRVESVARTAASWPRHQSVSWIGSTPQDRVHGPEFTMEEQCPSIGGGISSFGMSHSSRNFPSSQSLMGNSLQSQLFNSNPALDLSEFPSLTNRGSQEGSAQSLNSNPMAGRAAYGKLFGMVKQPNNDSNEFHIHNEDFPALPGSQGQENSQDSLSKQTSNATSESSKDGSGFSSDKVTSQPVKRGIQTSKDGTVTNIPAGMVTDQYGMVGLLTFIRAAETDPNLVSLALGSDLTTLGLNLNSPENLYPVFGGPWAEQPCRPQDIDYHVPSEYIINQSIRDKLAGIKLNRYGEDLLFFIFYMFGGRPVTAAFCCRVVQPGLAFPQGRAVNWRKVAKEFHLDYDRLEDRPQQYPPL